MTISKGIAGVGGSSAALAGAERAALWALAGLVGITVAWWALALWPPTDAPPAWLLRTREVCFNTGPDGLPDPSGWMLLIGQPIGMLAVLMVFAGDAVRGAMGYLRRSYGGRLALTATAVLLIAGAAAAGVRVQTAIALDQAVLAGELPAANYPRLDREAPPLALVDQLGAPLTLERFRGQPVFVTFAFGHCETVCPLVVRETRRARDRLRDDGIEARVVVVTLDPWRDTPSRLPHLARQWELAEGDVVASGEVDRVNAVLDDWQVARERDVVTGDVVHPSLVFVVDAEGRIAYAAAGVASLLEELGRRL